MKKLFFVLTACLAFVLTSCEKNSSNEEMIIGNWKTTTMDIVQVNSGHYIKQTINYNMELYILADQSFMFNEEGETQTGSWMLNGTTLIMNYGKDYIDKFTIQKLTKNELILRLESADGYYEYPYKRK